MQTEIGIYSTVQRSTAHPARTPFFVLLSTLLGGADSSPVLWPEIEYGCDMSKPRMTLNMGFLGGVHGVLDSCSALERVGQAPKGRRWGGCSGICWGWGVPETRYIYRRSPPMGEGAGPQNQKEVRTAGGRGADGAKAVHRPIHISYTIITYYGRLVFIRRAIATRWEQNKGA